MIIGVLHVGVEMQHHDLGWRALPLMYQAVGLVSLFLGTLLSLTFTGHFLADGVPAVFANKDFANYWTAGKLILGGQVQDLFGPHPLYFRHLTDAFGPDYQWHNWSYPPHFLLLIWPLGYAGYELSLAIFVLTTLAIYLGAVRAFVGDLSTLTLIAVGPFLVLNAWTAQNGFLFGALALAALSLRDSRPIAAGIALGFLTIKPQLGVLFPLLLLIERRWLVIASATITTLGLVTLSGLIFGWEAWRGYIVEVLPYQSYVMRALEGTFLTMLPSVYGFARLNGVGWSLALTIHMVVAIPALLVAGYLMWRLTDPMDRSLVVLIATFLITPYALNYDLGFLAAAMAVLAARQVRDRPDGVGERILIALTMCLTLYMMPMGALGIHCPPLLIAYALFLAARPLWAGREFARLRSPASASN